MPAQSVLERINDAVVASLPDLDVGRVITVCQEFQEVPLVDMVLREGRIATSSGYGVNRNFNTDADDDFEFKSFTENDTVVIQNHLKRMFVPYVHGRLTWGWYYQELKSNMGRKKIVDLLKPREDAKLIKMWERMEKVILSMPPTADAVGDLPLGLPYWVTSSATRGFAGGASSPHTTKGGLTPSSNLQFLYNRTGTVKSISRNSMLAQMEEAYLDCKWRTPITPKQQSGPAGQRYRWICGKTAYLGFTRMARQQNNDLGNELFSKEGQVTFKGAPFILVYAMDSGYGWPSLTTPVAGIDFNSFYPVAMDGDFMRRTGPHQKEGNPDASYMRISTSMNFIMEQPWRNILLSVNASAAD